MLITKTCGLNLVQLCQFYLSGIKELYVGYSKDANFIINNNIITDIFPMSWYKIRFSNAKISSNLSNSIEQSVLDFEVPYIDYLNKIELSKLKDNEYSFLIVTRNNEVYFLDSSTNTQFIEQYTGNGFIIKQLSTKNKSIYQVDFNYYLYITNNLPITPRPPIDDCSQYYNDLALSSIQPNALSVTCLVEDYDGWI
jgi:hypothetical protein